MFGITKTAKLIRSLPPICVRRYTTTARPLERIRVLDMSRVLAGPWCTQHFGDLGAEVIKIENPKSGDDTRQWGPPFYSDGENIQSAYFASANRNKKSIVVDISSPDGSQIIRSLAEKSDVFIENFKVGALSKYGLDYESIKKINPKIIYCSITGFGQDGPMKDLPGYDFAIQAIGGLMSITGPRESPYKVGVAVVDLMTGMYCSSAILSSLFHRFYSGVGQRIDISLLDVQASFLANQAMNYLVSGVDPERVGNSHPNIAPYDSLKTKDGFIVITVGNDSQFQSLLKVIELGELGKDERFATNRQRVANRKELLSLLSFKIENNTTAHWVAALGPANVPCAPINSLSQVYNHPQVIARDMIWNLPLHTPSSPSPPSSPASSSSSSSPTPSKGTQQIAGKTVHQLDSLSTVGSPIHFSDTPVQKHKHMPPPSLGEHTKEVLQSILGFSDEHINNLVKEKVIAV